MKKQWTVEVEGEQNEVQLTLTPILGKLTVTVNGEDFVRRIDTTA